MPLRSSLAYRAKWASLGVFYGRRLNLRSVRIGGRRFHLSFPPEERQVQEYEFGRVVFDDCYRLALIQHPVRTVLDIGANVGLFALAARRHFPKATIHCYEPNAVLAPHLRAHCEAVGATAHMTAIGSRAGTVSLQVNFGTLHTVSKPSASGSVQQIAFSEAVSRLGHVDVLKLDCEGAEWDIFSDPDAWENVGSLVMEYHLWAKPESTVDVLEVSLRDLGFRHVSINADPNGNPWGFAFASDKRSP